MTTYAFDEARHSLLTTWETGAGWVAGTVAELPASAELAHALFLADSLTGLSRHLWRTYTHPASAAGSFEANRQGWLRQAERDAFADVIPAITNPNLPTGDMIAHSHLLVEEAAHRVGRALHVLGEQTLTGRVVADVEQELAAVEQAERGDLSGRAKQAVVLTRADASPIQVAAADDLLRAFPLGSLRLRQELDPTAAAVAAAHWLQAAAEIASEVAGCSPTAVVREADSIEALDIEIPSLVLAYLHAGGTPRTVVIGMVRAAMIAAEGNIPVSDSLIEQMRAATREAERQAAGGDQPPAAVTFRVTPLDPLRPARGLLEGLLEGIRGCWILYREYAEKDPRGAVAESDEELAKGYDNVDLKFFDAVRKEAAEHSERLL
ncbi:hypothetical protein ACFS2C_08905 [Prauserella oleivorans]|uniref:DUF222 domain-containing protein n=1 Tax=Prauserella oleivorans TaxID=1478153 RepID=A0ABW5WAZ5_9PSEU